jgi:hypothetical protein
MIRDRKPTKQSNKQNPKDMLKNKLGKRRGRNRRRNDDGCCEELDHFFVCCIKLFSFIEVILFAIIGAGVVVYIVSTSSTGKETQIPEYYTQVTGPDYWFVRTYYTDNKCVVTAKSTSSNGYRLDYCMPNYGSSDKLSFNATGTLHHIMYEGDNCKGTNKTMEYNTYVDVDVTDVFGECTAIAPETYSNSILKPPIDTDPPALYFKDILLSITSGADPRNPTTKELPVAFLKAKEIIAPPEIVAETNDVHSGRMGNGDCFVQVMEKLNHGVFISQDDLTSCIQEDGKVRLDCLDVSQTNQDLGSYELPSKKVDDMTNSLIYDDGNLCINTNEDWGYLWTYETTGPTYSNRFESNWVQTFFIGVGIVIASLVGLNTLQEVYFMFTQKDYKVEF